MKILIIGASGFIGRETVKVLINTYGKSNIFGFSNTKLDNINYFLGDINDKKSLESAIKNIDIIMHLATPRTNDKEIINKIIVEGTGLVLKLAKEYNIKKIIFLSSYSVMRKNKDDYALAKIKAEKLIINSGINYVILRPTMVYGCGGELFDKILNSTKIPFILPIIGDGKYKLGPVYVKDLARIISQVIDKKYNHKVYYILGPLIDYNNFIKYILKSKNEKRLLLHLPVKLIVFCIKIFKFLRLTNLEPETIYRAVEDVGYSTDDAIFFNYKSTPLKKGLRQEV